MTRFATLLNQLFRRVDPVEHHGHGAIHATVAIAPLLVSDRSAAVSYPRAEAEI